jgi:hypothetical protein
VPLTKAQQRALLLKPKEPKRILQSPITRSPMTRLFRNDQEYGHFQRFLNETAQQLTGVLESDLWSRLIPQTCETEPCIRHAVSAIGALDFKVPSIGYETFNKSSEFAYQQYGLAIKELRKAAEESRADIRTKLIACLLFACFEFYHGNSDLALSQVFAGVEMLRNYAKFRCGVRLLNNFLFRNLQKGNVRRYLLSLRH